MAIATDLSGSRRTAGWPPILGDLALALAISAFVFATYAAAGLPTLANPGGDNDSLLRLVEVRDLLNGQGWYDLSQYRMGPEGGFVMHWSRLIDALLAGLILLASALGADAGLAETVALTLWPLLLMSVALAGLIAIGRSLGGAPAVFPAAALGAGALYFVGIYRPGSIDHHNAQIALTVWTIALLIEAPRQRFFAALAGACAALMLAIAMEAAPYVAAAGASAALAWLVRGDDERGIAAAFGASFAATTALVFMLTVAPRDWATPACDALSSVQLALAALGGLGLAVAASLPVAGRSFGSRLVALGLVGAGVAAVAVAAFPQCLADPYAAVDPRLREMWLDHVTEAQSVVDLARRDWTMLIAYYVTPALGLACLTVAAWRGATRARLLVGGFLVAAFAVSAWQLRGSIFAIPLASAALAAAVGRLRQRVAASPATPLGTLALAAAWLLSFNIAWSAAAATLRSPAEGSGEAPRATADACSADASFGTLAALPRGTVLAVSDLGSPILANTPHRVLSGPYHRNIAGNLAMLDAMLGEPEAARQVIRTHKVDYVAVCAGNPETRSFARQAPRGLLARLAAGQPPAWLALEPSNRGQAIEVYRVAATGSP